ncbi:energy transducer TonB [Rhodoplanes sp. SY1]|uniref:energy transducer TonB family protein n=1 Tax=Rhodoplanes sp. SY1 TaxID=3166646 RepID=UPI0038B57FFD
MLDVSDLRSKAVPPPPAVPDLRAGPAQRPAPPAGRVVDVALPVGDNIVPFRRPSPAAAEGAPSVGSVDASRRPAPLAPEHRRALVVAAALVVSLAVHTGLYAWLDRPAEPLASIGLESMSVELVLGADSAAGRAAAPSPEEAESAAATPAAAPPEPPDTAAADDPRPAAEPPAEVSATDPKEPAEVPTASTTPPDATVDRDVPPAVEPVLATPAPAVDTVASPAPVVRPPDPPAPKPAARRAEAPRKPAQRAAKPRRQDVPATRESRVAAVAASAGSSGVGIGRSDAQSNYPGLVLAHLARFKQYPGAARAQARGGVARVRFTLDGGGRVTGVSLAQGSGHADLDQESVAVVRRASPFPAPPGGRPQSFTLPVRFGLR